MNKLGNAFSFYKEKQFSFLNKTIKFETELGWHDPNIKQLWRYNLHYFDYAREIGVYQLSNVKSDKPYKLYKELVESWINNNKHIGIGDGWHPYTVSLRLVNWIFAYFLFYKNIEEDNLFKEDYIQSIYLQSIYLFNNLEFDVYGNHLFENAKTLIIAGIFFSDDEMGDKFLNKGEEIITTELGEQILEDGGHFELSPMYHSIVLKGLSELINTYKHAGYKVPFMFLETQERMVNFLNNMLHPDGDIPLFNDAAFGVSNSPTYLIEYIMGESKSNNLNPFDKLMAVKGNSSVSFPEKNDFFIAKKTGYLVSRDNQSYFILDFGKPCPEYLPAHAHADIFSYELSVNGQRIITDTGTNEYTAGELRNFNRSSKAHNTVTYKNVDQSEVWGSFRVAERAKIKLNSVESNNSIVSFSGSHDGYMKRHGVIHGRQVLHIIDKAIVILDTVRGRSDILAEDINSYIHLTPEAFYNKKDYKIVTDKNSIAVEPLMNTAIKGIEKGNNQSLQGWYSPEFGKAIPRETLIYSPLNKVSRQHAFGYAFILDNQYTLKSKQTNNKVEITLISNQTEEKYQLDLLER